MKPSGFCIFLLLGAVWLAPTDNSTSSQTTTQPTQQEKYYPPEFYLVSPIVRRNTHGSLVNQSPCGGIQKGHTHYLTKPGGRLLVQWAVIQPSNNGNCTIKVGPGKDLGSLGVSSDKDVVLQPLDGSGDSETGSFNCGRVMTKFEAKEVRLPSGLSCDACVLQIVWNTENGDIYQCADIMIDNDEVTRCSGQCKNFGVCMNGKCECSGGYTGKYCEKAPGRSSVIPWGVIIWIIVLLILIVIMIFIIIKYWPKRGVHRPPSRPLDPLDTDPPRGAHGNYQ